MALFSGIRLLFYAFNADYFPPLPMGELARISFFALRFDLAAIVYINALFILLSILPIPQRAHPRYQQIQKYSFLIFNALALIIELTDIAYFGFAYRRIIGSDLRMLAHSTQQTGTILLEYWYLILLFFLLLYLLHRAYDYLGQPPSPERLHLPYQIALFLLSVGGFAIAARGGLQMRPVMPITASDYVEDKRLLPLPSNASLQLIFSIQQRHLKVPTFIEEAEAEQLQPLNHQPRTAASFTAQNILVIVLESFGRNQIGFFQTGLEHTPFLDSLLQQGLYAEQSYANGLRSTQGIVAISSGIPALMEDPLMFSAYQSNRVASFAALLGLKGYTSGFFHGANPGSMEFERFAQLSGFDQYYDIRAYDNPADYDGNWGIWDLPFFQFTARALDQYPQPFAALLFSLTSHHPFRTEEWFEQRYPNLDPQQRSMRYTDTALHQFFQTARQMPWFNNTLFVITADHIGLSGNQDDRTPLGRFKVPILFYHPQDTTLKGAHPGLMQQIDILPSIMDYLDYDLSYKAFGNSIFGASAARYAYFLVDGSYQIADDRYLLLMEEKGQVKGLYAYGVDKGLREDLSVEQPEARERLERQLKAMIWQHHAGMVYNQLVE